MVLFGLCTVLLCGSDVLWSLGGWVIYDAIFFFLSAFISFLAEQLDSDVLERIGYDDRNFCFYSLHMH